MKTAIYIEDGVVQLVLSPQDKFETQALASFADRPMQALIKMGSFYECQGGWNRHSLDNQSLIIRVAETTPAAQEGGV